MWQKIILVSVLASVLLACGAEGTKTVTSTPADKPIIPKPKPVDNVNSPLIIEGDTSTELGKSVALVAYLSDDVVESYQWQQTTGAAVKLSSYRQGVVTFVPEHTGVYGFTVAVTSTAKEKFDKHFVVTVTKSTGTKIELLRDRAISGGRTFVMYFPEDIDVDNLSINTSANDSSVAINIDKDDKKAYVRVPKVTATKLVTLQFRQDQTIIDKAYILVEKNKPITSPYFCDGTGVYCATTEPLSRTFVYNRHSPYASVLAACTFSNSLKRNNLCTVDTLPPLGLDNQQVSHMDILDRVLVNEEWMGQRFADFLSEMDDNDDFKKLFGSVTAVVISDNIKVPFYWALTGTIYLSPYDLYHGRLERLSLADTYDYHKYIAHDASTDFLWQYKKDNMDISLSDKSDRSKEYIYLNLATLLYHELAHANDFFPYDEINNMDKSKALIDNIDDYSLMISYQLGQQYPLTSKMVESLAKYSFQGQSVSPGMLNENSQTIAYNFMNDGANDLYNYVNDREDMAMLFEETMMKFRFNVDREIAIIDVDSKALVIGQRNRVLDARVSPRAALVSQNILPDSSDALSLFLNQNDSSQIESY